MKGENFRNEFKYPIKVYRLWLFEFSEGLEVRKIIVAVSVIVMILFLSLIAGATSNTSFLAFFFSNFLIILFIVPAVITFIVFTMKYDYKPVIPFLKDRYYFYRNANKAYEHFQEVATNQYEKELLFEPFKRFERQEGTLDEKQEA